MGMNRTLEQRISKLEKANRVLVLICAGLVVLPLLALAKRDSQLPEVLKARKFELLDEADIVRGEWTVNEFAINNAEGDLRARLFFERGSELELRDEEGNVNVTLGCDAERSYLELDVDERLVIQHDQKNGSVIFMAGPRTSIDQSLSSVVLLQAGETGATIQLQAERGRFEKIAPQVELMAQPDQEALVLTDKDGKVVHRVPPGKH